jgi:hypothetical protein
MIDSWTTMKAHRAKFKAIPPAQLATIAAEMPFEW